MLISFLGQKAGEEPTRFQAQLCQLCQGGPDLQVAPAQEGSVLQMLCVHQNEMHSWGGSPECEMGLGGDGGECRSIATGGQ